jgi:TatD DNase family protein
MGNKKKNNVRPQLPAGINIIDTHCHLDMISSGSDIGAIISRAAACGVAPIITVGTNGESSQKAIHYAAQYDSVYATVGIHPHNVQELNDSLYAELETLCGLPKVVAYGEIGLDYVKQYAPQDVQIEHFIRQVDLAKKMQLPLVIHDREAHDDILGILSRRTPFPAGGVMHCFSGSWHHAQRVLDLGFIISIPGMVTFNKATAMQEVVRKIPLAKLIIETDAPFLAPEPLRGKENMPEYLLYTAQKIADLRGLSLDEVARITTQNARDIFKMVTH